MLHGKGNKNELCSAPPTKTARLKHEILKTSMKGKHEHWKTKLERFYLTFPNFETPNQRTDKSLETTTDFHV